MFLEEKLTVRKVTVVIVSSVALGAQRDTMQLSIENSSNKKQIK